VIWAKTDAGRGEIRARALVKERAQRNLLLVIDGVKSEEMLLAALAGISSADFLSLQALGLIAPVRASGARAAAVATAAPAPTQVAAPAIAASPPLDFAPFADALTQLISHELGQRGFVLALTVQKADSVETLHDVAQRALEQIRERNGEAAAAIARRKLYGA
jgi:hypothetical protein